MHSLEIRTNVSGMPDKHSADDPLYPILAALTGRRLRMTDVYKAVDLSRAQYYNARKEGKLLTPDRLVVAAHHLGINPIELLIACNPSITVKDAFDYVEKKRAEVTETWEAGGRFPLAEATGERGTTMTMTMTRPVDLRSIRPGTPPL